MSPALAPRTRDPQTFLPVLKEPRCSLRIGRPSDTFEREADRAADAVTSNANAPSWPLRKVQFGQLQRQPATDSTPNQEMSTNPSTAPPQPNNYKEGAEKLGEAFLQSDIGKKLKDVATQDALVKGAEDLIATLPGKIIAGTAAASAVTALAATHKALPAQIPEIPLDAVRPGLKVKIDYEGPVDRPTKAMITFSYTPRGDKQKPTQTASEKYRAETARLAAEQEEFRAGLKYAPGTPEAAQQQAEQKMMDDYLAKKLGTLPGIGGRPLVPTPGPSGQTPGSQWSFSPLAQPDNENQLESAPSSSLPGTLQRKCSCQENGSEREECKNKSETMQRSAAGLAGSDVAPPVVDGVLQSSGRPLDDATRAFFEPRFGYDFSRVRVHSDAQAAESALAVNALAYTVGDRIAFAAGRYSPHTTEGRRLLAHELAHTIQQSGSAATALRPDTPDPVVPSRRFKSGNVSPRASRRMQRKIQFRDQPHYSGFPRLPELLGRLGAIAPNLKFSLDGANFLHIESKTGNQLDAIDVTKLNNFEKQMAGYVKSSKLIPLRITDHQGRLEPEKKQGQPKNPPLYTEQITIDDYRSGYVDIDDLLASDDLGLQEALVHFLRERSDVPNYAGRLGSQSTRLSELEFAAAHEAGVDAEGELMRDFFGDGTIQFDPFSVANQYDRVFVNERNDRIISHVEQGTGSQTGVQSIHIHVETADGKTLTPDQFKALVASRKGARTTPVHPKTVNGAHPNSLPGLRISAPGDALEREAESAAEAVLASVSEVHPATVARPSSGGSHSNTARSAMRRAIERQAEPSSGSKNPKVPANSLRVSHVTDASEREAEHRAERIAPGDTTRSWSLAQIDIVTPKVAPSPVDDVLRTPGEPLDQATRTHFEPRFGYAFDDVRIHTGEKASESAAAVSANAYTVGQDIVMDAPRQPIASLDRKLLAHELAHTIQPRSAFELRRQAATPKPEDKLLNDFAAKFPDTAKLIKPNPAAMKLVKEAADAGATFGGFAEDGPGKEAGRPYTSGHAVYVPKKNANPPVLAMSDFLFELNNAVRQPRFAALDAAAAKGKKSDNAAAKQYAYNTVEAEVEGMLRLGEIWFETKAKYLGKKAHQFDQFDKDFFLAEYQSFKDKRKTKDDIVKDVLARKYETGNLKGKTVEQNYIDDYKSLAQ